MPILTEGLTNTQILTRGEDWLSSIQKQVKYIAKIELGQRPCPNCGTLHNLPEAAGVAIDDFNFGDSTEHESTYRCSNCKRRLIHILPFIGEWHWKLDYSEAKPRSE